MKHAMRNVLLLALLLVFVLSLAACANVTPPPPDDPNTDTPPTPPPTPLTDVVILKDGANISDYVLIYPAGDKEAKDVAEDIGRIFRQLDSDKIMPDVKSDKTSVGEYEILVGKTNRPVSTTLAAEVDAQTKETKYGFRMSGTSLAIYAAGTSGWDACCDYLKNTLIVDNKDLILSSDYSFATSLTAQEYEQQRVDSINLANAAKIQELLNTIAQMPIENFYGSTYKYSWNSVKAEVNATGTYTREYDSTTIRNMTSTLNAQSYNAPSAQNSPTVGQHPRLLFTAEDIPDIRAAMQDPLCAKAFENFDKYKDRDIDGKLNALKYVDPKENRDTNRIFQYSNYNWEYISIIQAKAFYYAITGEELYGYQALYAYFNFIDTFDLGYWQTDQCRVYGYVAYIGALVYDWCYDLMTPEIREKFILGVQNACFVGYSSLPEGHLGSGAKTEVGFPPIGGSGAVEGHGCERELLCDFLAFSIAIYDEHPDWYELIGGRIFAQYIPVRNRYYSEAGIYPGGTGNYAYFRYRADEICAWLLTSATGKNPFDASMQQVARSFAAHVMTLKDGIFVTGDTGSNSASAFWETTLLSSFLFDDPYMRDYGKSMYTESSALSGSGPQVGDLLSVELLICAMKGTETEDYREGLDLVTYNGGFYQQIIARDNWTDDSPVVLLRGIAATFDHSHYAAGEFEIYYKGRLSIGDGSYMTYGNTHHTYYHRATIAHSCMLVFNPDKKDTQSGYYSGGQSSMGTSLNGYEDKVLGVKYGYDGEGNAKYVYYANNLTAAYESANDVDYVARSIVTTFPEGNYPMVMFIYDRIDVPDDDYIKTFLLQCNKEPTINTTNMTAIVDNGTGGSMVLKNLYGGASIAKYGASDPTGDQRYWISTQNKNVPSGSSSKVSWGKVEIRAAVGNRSDVMVNVVYVTDSANKSNMLATELLTGTNYYGARAAGQTAIFAFGTDGKSYARSAITFTATGSGTQDYYIGGLAAGTWQVSIGGQNLGNMTVADGEHVLVFPSNLTGTVTVTPIVLQ